LNLIKIGSFYAITPFHSFLGALLQRKSKFSLDDVKHVELNRRYQYRYQPQLNSISETLRIQIENHLSHAKKYGYYEKVDASTHKEEDEIRVLEYLIKYGGLNPWKYLSKDEPAFAFSYQGNNIELSYPVWWKDNEDRFLEIYNNYVPFPASVRGWTLYRQSLKMKRPFAITLK
jgi:hypothetical protein